MASVRTLVEIKRTGKYHPPGTVFHDFDLAEAEELGPRRVLILSPDEAPEAPEAPEFTPSPAGGLPGASGGPSGEATPGTAPPAPVPGGERSRIAEIMEAVDLLDESDWTATGRPKVKAISDVLGFKPNVDEIDAALKMREALQ